jgi:hypothetical protein
MSGLERNALQEECMDTLKEKYKGKRTEKCWEENLRDGRKF